MSWRALGLAVLLMPPISSAAMADQEPECQFNVIQDALPSALIGPDEIVARSRVINDDGSPVVILRGDLTEFTRRGRPRCTGDRRFLRRRDTKRERPHFDRDLDRCSSSTEAWRRLGRWYARDKSAASAGTACMGAWRYAERIK